MSSLEFRSAVPRVGRHGLQRPTGDSPGTVTCRTTNDREIEPSRTGLSVRRAGRFSFRRTTVSHFVIDTYDFMIGRAARKSRVRLMAASATFLILNADPAQPPQGTPRQSHCPAGSGQDVAARRRDNIGRTSNWTCPQPVVSLDPPCRIRQISASGAEDAQQPENSDVPAHRVQGALRAHQASQAKRRIAKSAWRDHDLVFCTEDRTRRSACRNLKTDPSKISRGAGIPSTTRLYDLRHDGDASHRRESGYALRRRSSRTQQRHNHALGMYAHPPPRCRRRPAHTLGLMFLRRDRLQPSPIPVFVVSLALPMRSPASTEPVPGQSAGAERLAKYADQRMKRYVIQ